MQSTELSVVEDVLEIDPPDPQQSLAPIEADTPAPREKGKRYLCRHIFTDGHRCGSYALRSQNFCYYHQTHRTPVLANVRRRQPQSGFDLTRLDGLDNATAIQLALSEVLGRIAANAIDSKTAWLLLYGLQVAAGNLRRSRPNPDPLPEAIVEDATHGQLAEPEEGRAVPATMLSQMKTLLKQSRPEDVDRLLANT
jgi:hypothetical protein